MSRPPSKPELRAQELFKRFSLSARIQSNDGEKNPQVIYLHRDKKGTSVVMKDGSLLIDDPKKLRPKSYTCIRPDKLLGADYLEIKGCISAKDWESLSRDAKNDNIRLLLLRIRLGNILNISKDYHELEARERSEVDKALSARGRSDRHYVRWDSFSSITSPNQNLVRTVLRHAAADLPIKVVSGMETLREKRLFIMDGEIMKEWENR